MVLHRNAKLGLAGRYALVCAVEDGCSLKSAAAAFSVSSACGVPKLGPHPGEQKLARAA
jgi:hypothetical protein